MNEDDLRALNACKGLRRNPEVIDDLRPLDSSSMHLEYSYRTLDNIGQFWAGPSHWKYRKTRASSLAVGSGGVKKKPLRKKHEPIIFTIDFDDSMFISVNSKSAQKLKKINVYKRWDAKKLKLPTDFQLDRNRYNCYKFAPGIPVEWAHDPEPAPELVATGYNYNNPEDQEYCSNIQVTTIFGIHN